MSRQQNEMAGRLASFAEAQEAARGELTRTLSEQLIQVSNNVNQNLKDSREKTTKSLGDLGERLSLIDKAQKEITALSGQVVELQHILDNKQRAGRLAKASLPILCATACPMRPMNSSTHCPMASAPTALSACPTARAGGD